MKRQVKSEYLCSNFISLRKGCNEKEIVLLLISCFDTLLSILDMVNKCCIYNSRSNYAGEYHTVVFSFPRDDENMGQVFKQKGFVSLKFQLNMH